MKDIELLFKSAYEALETEACFIKMIILKRYVKVRKSSYHVHFPVVPLANSHNPSALSSSVNHQPLQPKESLHSDVCWKIEPSLSGVAVPPFAPQPGEPVGTKSKMVGTRRKKKKEQQNDGCGAGEQLVERANINGS